MNGAAKSKLQFLVAIVALIIVGSTVSYWIIKSQELDVKQSLSTVHSNDVRIVGQTLATQIDVGHSEIQRSIDNIVPQTKDQVVSVLGQTLHTDAIRIFDDNKNILDKLDNLNNRLDTIEQKLGIK